MLSSSFQNKIFVHHTLVDIKLTNMHRKINQFTEVSVGSGRKYKMLSYRRETALQGEL